MKDKKVLLKLLSIFILSMSLAFFQKETFALAMAKNDAEKLKSVKENSQLILVTTTKSNTSKAKIQTFEKMKTVIGKEL